jgi:hypothetical protein
MSETQDVRIIDNEGGGLAFGFGGWCLIGILSLCLSMKLQSVREAVQSVHADLQRIAVTLEALRVDYERGHPAPAAPGQATKGGPP